MLSGNELFDTIVSLGLALALGLLVGTERGWQERAAAEGSRVAGIRTFGLIGLLGGLWELLSRSVGEIVLGFAFFAFAVVMVTAHVAEARVSKDFGTTTVIAALITFGLGALSVRGERGIAAAGAVVTAIILSLKPILHSWVQRIEPAELTAALKLLLISVVILPVLPDQGYGPWRALNPHELWSLVVVIAALSFAAYCGTRMAGVKRGILLTGLLGGLVSSTAVSIQLARLAGDAAQTRLLAAGVLVASAMMFVRVLVVVTIVNPNLSVTLSLPLLAMALTLFCCAALYARNIKPVAIDALRLRNPVELTQALQFALLLGAIFLATAAAREWLGETGLFLLAALSGIADVDAITISLSRMAAADYSVRAAGGAIILATLVNSGAKALLVATLGGMKLGGAVAWPLALCIIIGAVWQWRLGG
jgi:uncharacterized membrane protein (DUF4010 family)